MTSPRKRTIEERGEVGDYSDLVLPLDYMILDALTPEGTTMAGLYPIGSTTNAVGKTLGGQVPSSAISSRVRILHLLGLAVRIKSLGQGNNAAAWQRSAKAEELLKKWKESDGS